MFYPSISIVLILKSTPIVLKKLSLKEFSYEKGHRVRSMRETGIFRGALTAYLTRRQLFPTPLFPMRSILKR